MRSRIGERHDRARVLQNGSEFLVGTWGERLDEELIEIGGQGEVDDELHRVDPSGLGYLSHGGMRWERLVEQAHTRIVRWMRLGANRAPIPGLMSGVHQASTGFGVGESDTLFAQRQGPDRLPLGQLVER